MAIIEADMETALDSIKRQLCVIEAALLDNRPVRAYVKLTDTYEYIEELRGKLLARSKESPHAQP